MNKLQKWVHDLTGYHPDDPFTSAFNDSFISVLNKLKDAQVAISHALMEINEHSDPEFCPDLSDKELKRLALFFTRDFEGQADRHIAWSELKED